MLLTIVVVSFVTGFVFAFWHLTRQPSTGILPPGAVRLPGPKGKRLPHVREHDTQYFQGFPS